jgi:hypothetical protein
MPAMLIHTVFFWLHDSVTAADRKAFEAELAALMKTPCAQSGHWGAPAAIPPRPVVDASYDYAISTVFKTLADHDAYQTTDPVHKAFIANCKHWWKQVKVYDFEAR